MSQIREFESPSSFNPWKQIEALLSEKGVRFEITTVGEAYGLLASLKRKKDVAIVKRVSEVKLDRTVIAGNMVLVESYTKKLIKDAMTKLGMRYVGFSRWIKHFEDKSEFVNEYVRNVAQNLVDTALSILPIFDVVIIPTGESGLAPAFIISR